MPKRSAAAVGPLTSVPLVPTAAVPLPFNGRCSISPVCARAWAAIDISAIIKPPREFLVFILITYSSIYRTLK
jgi:hypothetical protein